MVSNSVLRQNARRQLGGNIFNSKWMTMLAVCAVLSIVSAAAVAMTVIGAIVLFLITGPITYGIARTTIECVEGDRWEFSHVFKGFSECLGKSIILGVLQGLFTFLWSLLFVIPGLVKTYSYAMTYYIQQDNPHKEPMQIITQSRRIMDGYKWKLFCLDFSFFGWYLLGALCFGVGVFFVTPYHQTARANFYEALKAEKSWSTTRVSYSQTLDSSSFEEEDNDESDSVFEDFDSVDEPIDMIVEPEFSEDTKTKESGEDR